MGQLQTVRDGDSLSVLPAAIATPASTASHAKHLVLLFMTDAIASAPSEHLLSRLAACKLAMPPARQ
jgi:hypothetical protein